MRSFKVYVDDNFHFMDEDERYCAGDFATPDEALAKCRSILDADLEHLYEDGMSVEDLVSRWSSFGKSPFAIGLDFSSIDYVRENAPKICRARDSYDTTLKLVLNRGADLKDFGWGGAAMLLLYIVVILVFGISYFSDTPDYDPVYRPFDERIRDERWDRTK